MNTLPAAFWAKVRKTDYCWLWQGAQNSKGYGGFIYNGRNTLTHRLTFEEAHGPIPEGMTLDHLCRTHNCCNPDPEHLEVVTNAENNRRKIGGLVIGEECVNGHIITPDLIYQHPRGHTECVECRREKNRAYLARKSAAA